MPWVYSVGSGTPPSYTWFGVNTYNQEASPVVLSSNCAVTQIKAYAAGNGSAVNTRLAIWSAGGSVKGQSSTFSMASGTQTVGGQAWHTSSITPVYLTAGTYWAGLYRNPSGGHIAGTTASGTTGYIKTNTSSFPAIASMSGYTSDDKRMYVGVFYITAPDAPSSASATRITDNSITISWTNNKDSDQPYDNLYLERYDNITGSYYAKATLSGSTTSYTDTTTIANRKYRYRIRAKNSAGYSSYAYTDYVNTTPAAPTNVVATRVSTTVEITWDDNATNEENYKVQRNTSTDGVSWAGYSTLTSALAAGTESYIDSSPANYNQYKISCTCTGPSLESTQVESNIVQTLRYPNVTSNLSPSNFEGVDIGSAIPITWQHNTYDGSAQTNFSIRFRVEGGAWSLYVNKTARVESYANVSTASFSVGRWEYEVRTWGAATTGGESTDGSGYYEGSGYELGSFTLENLPVGTITNPNTDPYPYSLLTMDWTYTQAEGYEQIAYIANLYDASDNLLESKTQSSNTTSIVFNYNLENDTTYKVTLQVQEENGLWSDEVEQEFTTDFYTPPVPTFELTLNEENGSIIVDITNPTPTGTEVDASYNELYRSVDGGDWELVLSNIPVNTSVTDYIPSIGGNNNYYVIAVSDVPSIALSLESDLDVALTGRFFLNGGNSFEDVVKIEGDVIFNESLGNETIVKKFEGRQYPVKYESTKLTHILNFTGDLLKEYYDVYKKLVEETGEKYFRDYEGRRILCDLSQNKLEKKDNLAYQISCIITKVESEV